MPPVKPPPPPSQQDDAGVQLMVIAFIMGLVCLGMTVLVWMDMNTIEAQGSVKMNVIEAIAYRIGGKWAAIGLFLVPGVGLLGLGGYLVLAGKKK